jgi:hypothetical protein
MDVPHFPLALVVMAAGNVVMWNKLRGKRLKSWGADVSSGLFLVWQYRSAGLHAQFQAGALNN